MPTTHNSAEPGQIAKTVLITGDPLRAKYIAETFLKDVVCYNTVRNMLGFTGRTSADKLISIQGSGMGMPSLSIYVNELIDTYGVKKIIRVGSCGSLNQELKCGDMALVMGSCSDSNMNRRRFENMDFAPVADWELLLNAYEIAKKFGKKVIVVNNFATDKFYGDSNAWKIFAKYNVKTIEMESAELYTLAAEKSIQALSILTVSDSLIEPLENKMTAEEREKSLVDMFEIAFEL